MIQIILAILSLSFVAAASEISGRWQPDYKSALCLDGSLVRAPLSEESGAQSNILFDSWNEGNFFDYQDASNVSSYKIDSNGLISIFRGIKIEDLSSSETPSYKMRYDASTNLIWLMAPKSGEACGSSVNTYVSIPFIKIGE
jgi:hypothetical protein